MSAEFLARWSRRKHAARQAEPAAEPADVPAPEAVPGPAQTDSAVGAGPGEPAAAPAEFPELPELPELPKLEDLTPDSDLSAFLGQGVPESLRNAALRRMWTLDPAIRDFVGEARDYAWDWNTPGGVPGSGELLPGQDVGAMVRRVFGESEPPEAAEPTERAAVSQDRDLAQPSGAEPPPPAAAQPAGETAGLDEPAAGCADTAAQDDGDGTAADARAGADPAAAHNAAVSRPA